MSKPVSHYDKWRIRWKDENGRRQSATFDTYKDALYELRKRESESEDIRRGFKNPKITDKTFADLCDYWLTKRVPLKRDGANDISTIRRHLLPEFGHLPVRKITIAHTDEYQAKRAYLDKKTINNHLTLLISMLNVGVDLNWLDKCPKIRKPKVPILSSEYRYLKTEDEIQKFLRAAQFEDESIYLLYLFAIYTGMRQGEIASLKKASVDFEKRLIVVQTSFNGPTKAGDIRYVPILDPLLPVLQSWFLKCPGDLVFPNSVGKMFQESAWIFQETLHRILTRANFPKISIRGKERRYIRFHDLRHTFASHWVMNGGDIFKLQKILGHKSLQMTMRYAHLTPDAFSADYGRLGSSVAPPSATVIPLRNHK